MLTCGLSSVDKELKLPQPFTQKSDEKARAGGSPHRGQKQQKGPYRGKEIGRADSTASTPPLPSEGRVLIARQSKKQYLPRMFMLSKLSMMLAA